LILVLACAVIASACGSWTSSSATVCVADLDETRAQETVDFIRAEGGKAETVIVDVTDDVELKMAVASVLSRHGRIDILHNHAGAQVAGDLETMPIDGLDFSWNLNVRAHLMAARYVMPVMKAQKKGVILNTASSSGVLYDREMIAYTTTKHAVIAMTKQMAGDYAGHGIRVNALCPGWVDTPFNAPFIAQMGGREAIESYIKEKVPMGRWPGVKRTAQPSLFAVGIRSSTRSRIACRTGRTVPFSSTTMSASRP